MGDFPKFGHNYNYRYASVSELLAIQRPTLENRYNTLRIMAETDINIIRIYR